MANGTPSILSESARRWLGSAEGVPPQMLPARAEMAAKTGLMSFQDALMIKQLADQIRGSNNDGNIPQSNVMQDKLMQISGRAPVQAQPPQMQQPQPQGAPEDPRMQGGLGTLSAPNMENAQFAGGGIIAFAGDDGSYTGSGLSESDRARAAERERLRLLLEREAEAERNRIARARGEDVNTLVGGQYPTHGGDPMKEPLSASEYSLKDRIRDSVQEEKAPPPPPGLGVSIPSAAQAGLRPVNIDAELAKEDYSEYDKWGAELQKEKDARQKEAQYDRRMALAAAGFKMAQAASQPGATFMGALSEGGAEGIRGLSEARKRVQEADAKTRELMMSLEMSKGADKRGARRSLLKAYNDREEAIAEYGIKAQQLRMQGKMYEARMAAAQAAAAAKNQGASPQVAKAVSQLTMDRYAIQEKVAMTPEYMAYNEIYKNNPNSKEGRDAARNMELLVGKATVYIDKQLADLNENGRFAVVGQVPEDEDE